MSRARYIKALTAYVDAAHALLDAWPAEVDGNGYPESLPSFDEHCCELSEWKHAEKAVSCCPCGEPVDDNAQTVGLCTVCDDGSACACGDAKGNCQPCRSFLTITQHCCCANPGATAYCAVHNMRGVRP